jgi:vesicle transport protein SEC22
MSLAHLGLFVHVLIRVWRQAGAYSFHYVIVDTPSSTTGAKICFLTLAEKGCPRRLAFDYLDDLQKEFIQLHGQQVPR